MTPKKILLMAHDVTLAHLGRPLRLAEGLIADGHDVTLAASAESARFLKNFPARGHTLAPTGKARFIDNLAKGRPVLPSCLGCWFSWPWCPYCCRFLAVVVVPPCAA